MWFSKRFFPFKQEPIFTDCIQYKNNYIFVSVMEAGTVCLNLNKFVPLVPACSFPETASTLLLRHSAILGVLVLSLSFDFPQEPGVYILR